MKYCIKCGRLLSNSDQFCTACGLKQPYISPELLYPQNQPFLQPPVITQNQMLSQPPFAPYYNTFVPARNFASQKTGALRYIIWSLILFVFFNPIGTPLSLISALLSVSANATSDHLERNRYLGIAAKLCLIATFVDILTIILLIISANAMIRTAYIY